MPEHNYAVYDDYLGTHSWLLRLANFDNALNSAFPRLAKESTIEERSEQVARLGEAVRQHVKGNVL